MRRYTNIVSRLCARLCALRVGVNKIHRCENNLFDFLIFVLRRKQRRKVSRLRLPDNNDNDNDNDDDD